MNLFSFFRPQRFAQNQAAMAKRAQQEEPLRYGIARQIRLAWIVFMVLEAVYLWRAGAAWGDLALALALPAFFLALSFNPVKPVARSFVFVGVVLTVTLITEKFMYPQYGGALAVTIVLAGLLVGEFFVGVWTFICCVPLMAAMSKGQPWTVIAGWAAVYVVTGWLVILFSRHLERLLEVTVTAEEQQRNAIIVERTRFAREIHDTLAQGFTGIMMQLNAAAQRLDGDAAQARAHLERARELAQSSLDEARRSVSALRAGVLTDSTLFEALQQIGKELAGESKVAVEAQLDGVPQSLPEQVESNLLRVGQEALTNAVRHSGGDRINIRLAYQPDAVVLEVEDNGKGGALAADAGFGIEGMRDRTRQIGGQIDIRSRPGRGTRLVIIVPNA